MTTAGTPNKEMITNAQTGSSAIQPGTTGRFDKTDILLPFRYRSDARLYTRPCYAWRVRRFDDETRMQSTVELMKEKVRVIVSLFWC